MGNRVWTAKDYERCYVVKKEAMEEYEQSFWKNFWGGIKKNKLAMFCLGVLIIISIFSLLAPLSPYEPDAMSPEKLMGPSLKHFFGTDMYGRDYFTRALYGGRISISVGLASALCSAVLGTCIGTFSGYIGGKVDMLCMRLADIFMSLPSFLVMIVLNTFFKPGIGTLVFLITIFSWPSLARITRVETMSLKERDFIQATRILGGSHLRVIFLHIIPNMLGPIIVTTCLSVAGAILTESSLSYLGLGVSAPQASWGSMLQDAQDTFLNLPSLSIYPGVLILLTVLSFNILGNVVRDAMEAKINK